MVRQHDRRFIVLENQYGRRDVMRKRSIGKRNVAMVGEQIIASSRRQEKEHLAGYLVKLRVHWVNRIQG